MRFLLVTYIARAKQKSNQLQQDEIVTLANRIKPNDLDLSSVILDFRNRTVIKSSVGEQIAPKDFQRIRDYYYQYYSNIIDQLEAEAHEK